MSSSPGGPNASGAYDLDGEATLFGFDPTPVHGSVVPRTRAWRVGGAVRTMAVFVLLAPFVAIVPPHAVWPIGALLTGGLLARRRYVERFSLRRLDGACPRCGRPLPSKPTRLRSPHPVPCPGCNHEINVRFPAASLQAIAAD